MPTIWIRCKQVVEYSKQCNVSDKDYEILLEADGGDVSEFDKETKKAYRIIESRLRPDDVLDVEMEYTDVSIKLDAEDEDEEEQIENEEE